MDDLIRFAGKCAGKYASQCTGIIFLFVLTSACGANMDYIIQNANSRSNLTTELNAQLNTSQGTSIDLQISHGKSTVLIFSEETCEECQKEAVHLVESLKNPEVEPAKVRVVTVLLGSTAQDAEMWRQDYSIPWTVAYELKANLFKSLCPLGTVPCVIVANSQNKIIFRKHGLVEFKTLTDLTGPWED